MSLLLKNGRIITESGVVTGGYLLIEGERIVSIGKGSAYPHPELPFGTIATLAVWKDRLFVVDAMNARIAKCRIVYDPAQRMARADHENR